MSDCALAVSYVRVSGVSQAAGDGPQRQRACIEARASAMGLRILRQFEDIGVSGTKGFEDRPGLLAAMEAAAEVGAVLLVEKADRLARDLVVSELTLRECRRLSVRVVEAENGTDLTAGDSSNPTATMLLGEALGDRAAGEVVVLPLHVVAVVEDAVLDAERLGDVDAALVPAALKLTRPPL